MICRIGTVLVAVLLVLAGTAGAADKGLAGNWKVTIFVQGQHPTLWLIKLQAKDGKWTGDVLGRGQSMPEASLTDVSVSSGMLRFALKVQSQRFTFEGKVPEKEADKSLGSLTFGPQMLPAQLERTSLTSLEKYEVAKETIAKDASGPDVIEAALTLLHEVGNKKAKPEDVRSWAAKAFKSAEPYGERLQREVAVQVAEAVAEQKELTPVALEYARKAERLLGPKEKPNVQKRVLGVLAAALQGSGKDDEAKEVENRSRKIDWVRPEPFAGRKENSDAVVLVELFTGAQCPPCVAADLAFDALAKTYKPAEVVLLQYHVHIPGPDPLTNPDTETRQEYYQVDGTPFILFNGKAGPAGGGANTDAQDRYEDYHGIIDPLLEKTGKARLKVDAVRKGNKIEVAADVSGLQKPGEKVRLRFALVEEQVKYTGGNRLSSHQYVVRSLPGGAAGLALKEKSARESATVDLEELRKTLKKYLDSYDEKDPFPNKDRPMDLKQLHVVAFVQDDATREVLQAARVPLRSEDKSE